MIFTDGATAEPIPISEVGSGYGGYFGAKVSEAAAEWPIQRGVDIVELNRASGRRPVGGAVGSALSAVGLNDERPVPEGAKMLSLAEARDKLKSEGVDHRELHITNEGVSSAALDIMTARLKARRERESTIERGPDHIWTGALGVGTSFLVGAVDPLNLASGFIPVVGQARYANMMAGAGMSTVARAAVRARVGALEGAVGQAMLEPIEVYATSQEGGDYTMASALHSIMFGAALGSSLRAGGGAVADVIRQRRDRPLFPFDIGEPGSNHPEFKDLSTLKPQESLAARPESPFLPGRTAPFEDVLKAGRDLWKREQAEAAMKAPDTVNPMDWIAQDRATREARQESIVPSPHVEALNDLPPRAKEDLTRIAIANLHDGQPVKVGEVLNATSSDPRIRESLDLVSRPEVRSSARRVGDDVSDQLVAAGVSADEAKVNAALMAARYATRAQRLGRDAHELYQADGVAVRKGETPAGAGRSFDQFRSTAPTFYSAVLRTIEAGKIAKGSPDQWLATIRNTPGVKPEELEWLGLAEWLKAQKGAVTKEQVAEYVRANQIEVKEVSKGAAPQVVVIDRARELAHEEGFNWDDLSPHEQGMFRGRGMDENGRNDTKFSNYQLPGGENYRELLLTLPPAKLSGEAAGKNLYDNFIRRGGGQTWEQLAPETRHEMVGRATEQGRGQDYNSNKMFRSSHWDEPNVLAHVRFNDRTIDGKRTLFVEEIQSDWHQQGRTKGYSRPVDRQAMRDLELARDAALKRWEELSDKRDDAVAEAFRAYQVADRSYADYRIARDQGVPDAPFKTTWPELLLKRMIRYAAENGYDQVAWTPGHVQAERYDLRKQVNALHITRDVGNGNFHIEATTTNGKQADIANNVAPEGLGEYIGKDLSKKIAEDFGDKKGGKKTYSGLDLKVGGEGMSGFYDKILPAAVNKLVKKYGTRVGSEHVGVPHKDGKQGMDIDVHTLAITPELRAAAISQGFPLFQRAGEGDPRGRITLSENQAIITLFHSADKSTFLHESGHLFLDQLARDAQLENVPQALKDDLGTVLRWLGVDRVEDIGVPQHEQWARGFEQYLMSGKAPSSALVKAFQAFKEWLGAIYRSLRDLGEPLPDEIRGVMDRMLATDAEIADRAPKTKEEAWAALSKREPEPTPPTRGKPEHPASLQPQEIPEGLAREVQKADKGEAFPSEPVERPLVPVSASAKAAAKAEAIAKQEYDALVAAGEIAPEANVALEAALAAIDTEASLRARVMREGAGCLAGGFGFAAVAPQAKAATAGVKIALPRDGTGRIAGAQLAGGTKMTFERDAATGMISGVNIG
jgi:hypothetical protein